MHAGPKKVEGLTFVELLVAVTVAAILASIAFPDFVGFIKNNRSATEINDVLSSLTLARSEAVKRNTRVAVCKSAGGRPRVAADSDDSGVVEDVEGEDVTCGS